MGDNWLKKAFPKREPSELGCAVARLLDDWQGGIYHLQSTTLERTNWENPQMIEVPLSLLSPDLATHDFDNLTRLVFLAHDYALRVAIVPRAHRWLVLRFWQCAHEGQGFLCHPSIEDALTEWRKLHSPIGASNG